MADLTLDEYRDYPEDELQKIFQAEIREMYGTHVLKDTIKGCGKKANPIIPQSNNKRTSLTFRYWDHFLSFIYSPIHKLQNIF
jgi:hypothetical protein